MNMDNTKENPRWGSKKVGENWGYYVDEEGYIPEKHVEGTPVEDFLEEWLEAPAIYTLDLFPKNVTYGTFDLKARNLSAMEFLFLDSPPRFLELQRKFLRILARMACYYPYSHLIVNYWMHLFPHDESLWDEEEGEYHGNTDVEYFDAVFPQETAFIPVARQYDLVEEMFDCREETRYLNTYLHFYFSDLQLMVTLQHNDVFPYVQARQEPPQEFLDLLRQFTEAEGLFLRKLEQEGEEA